jgi:hypothetical protein
MDPIGSIGFVSSMLWRDVINDSPTRTSSVTPRVSLRTLMDEDSETLVAVRNGPHTRVGSVASVVATTSSIAIQGVVILDEPHSRQSLAEIFFIDGSTKSAATMVGEVSMMSIARASRGCDDTQHASRPRSWRIRQRGVDETLRRRIQATRNRCDRGRSSSRGC